LKRAAPRAEVKRQLTRVAAAPFLHRLKRCYPVCVNVRVKLAQGVADVAALGADDALELFAPHVPRSGAERAQVVRAGAAARLIRLPLPGTPHADGPLTDRPRGSGTGWIFVRQYSGAGLGRALSTRFGSPPSASLAEREWNVLCHLRAHGVVTPEPLAVGARAGGWFSKQSFLVTRAIEEGLSAPLWFAEQRDEDLRNDALLALGLTLQRVADARVELPHLAPEHLLILPLTDRDQPETAGDACGLEQIIARRERNPVEFERELKWKRLPDIVLTSVRAGRAAKRADVALEQHLEQLRPGLSSTLGAREWEQFAQTARGLDPRDLAER